MVAEEIEKNDILQLHKTIEYLAGQLIDGKVDQYQAHQSAQLQKNGTAETIDMQEKTVEQLHVVEFNRDGGL